MKRVGLGWVLAIAFAGGAGQGVAQPAWDSPMLLPPVAREGTGVFLMDAAGGGIGLMGLYRSPLWNYGLRAGVVDSNRRDRIAVFAGIDYNGLVTRATRDFPLDVDWVFGAGLSFDDNIRVSIPLGLTTGYSFRGDGVVFSPYGTPRIVLDAFLGSGDRDRRSALSLGVDLGLDVDLGTGFLIRFGATVGRGEAVALGIFF
jgi:hypothetical protein